MSGCPCPESTIEQVGRVFYPSHGDRIERKKFVAISKEQRSLTGEERILRIKARVAGNYCDPSGCAWPANWVTR
jgi:hypothetical protein